MKIIRNIKINLIKILTSYGFYICIIATFLFCLSAEAYIDDIKNEQYSIVRLLAEFDRTFFLEHTELCSFNIILKGSGSWLTLFIPIIAAFAFVPLVCDEYDAKAVRFSIFRSSKSSFHTAKFLTACFMGGLAVLIGYGIFTAFVSFTFPAITEYSPALQEMFTEEMSDAYQSFAVGGYHKLLAAKFFEMFLYGMVFAVPANLCTALMSNKYLVLCIPFFIKYAVNQTCTKLTLAAWSDFENPNVKLGRLCSIINPDAIAGLSGHASDKIYIVLYNGALVLMAYVLYLIILNRRVDCGE